jgi:hypothetical protein
VLRSVLRKEASLKTLALRDGVQNKVGPCSYLPALCLTWILN